MASRNCRGAVPSTHYMPIAVAVIVGGAMLALAADEALAPDAGHDSATSCLPEDVATPRPERLADPVQIELVKHLSRRYLIAGEATERMVGAAYRAAHQVGLDPL